MLAVAIGACTSHSPRATSGPAPTTVEDDESADVPGGPFPPPTVAAVLPPTSGGGSCRSGDPLANVYHPRRLEVIRPCITVTGTVAAVRLEPDGDIHINVKVDPAFAALVNDRNRSGEFGALVVEVVPADQLGCTPGRPPRPRSGTYDFGVCTGAGETAPAVDEHVSVTGPYVIDLPHGWTEIHPAWAIAAA